MRGSLTNRADKPAGKGGVKSPLVTHVPPFVTGPIPDGPAATPVVTGRWRSDAAA